MVEYNWKKVGFNQDERVFRSEGLSYYLLNMEWCLVFFVCLVKIICFSFVLFQEMLVV